MEITMIMSGLALLAATASFVLLLQEKKCNKKRNAAMIDYIDSEVVAAKKHTEKAICEKIDPVLETVESIGNDVMKANNSFQDQLGKTLSNIMAFDPLEAQRKSRFRAMGMGEDE